jgi:hypothetical protein
MNKPRVLKIWPIRKGDYVLGTKYRDGDPRDGFAVGFASEQCLSFGLSRLVIVDNSGAVIGLANGFRRVKKISSERGNWIVRHLGEIEQSGRSVWYFARCSMKTKLKPLNQ